MATMNLKTIEKKLATLKQSKDAIEKKRAESIKLFDAQIADLTKQINSFDKVKTQLEKLMKLQEEQMQMAADLELEFSGKKPEKEVIAEVKNDVEDDKIDNLFTQSQL